MKKAVICFLILAISNLAYGETRDQKAIEIKNKNGTHYLVREKLAGQLLNLLCYQQMFEERFKSLETLINSSIVSKKNDTKNYREIDYKIRRQICKLYINEFRWKNFQNHYIKIYANAYDEDELRGLINFYSSPLGRKSVEKGLYISRAVNALILKTQKKLMIETENIIENNAISSVIAKTKNHQLAGDLYFSRRDFEKAIIQYRKAIEQNPYDYNSLNNLAWLFATCREKKFRDKRKALELAKRASKIKPDPNILDTLAKAYAVNGEFKNAIRILKKVIGTAKESKIDQKALSYYKKHLEEVKEQYANTKRNQ